MSRKNRVRTRGTQGQVVGDGNTQINNYGQTVSVAAVMAVVVGAVGGAFWVNRDDGSPASGENTTPQVNPGGELGGMTGAPTSSVKVTTSTAAPANWYDLTKLQSVVWNNGFNPVDPVRIGAGSYPAGIVGSYQSSSTDQNNKAVWAIGGQCTEFSAWVGKRADSSGGGTGRFVVMGDDRELFSAEVGPNDPAVEVRVDITGVIRLTLFDIRRLSDATNAWGRPRVLCGTAPGPTR